MTKKERFSAILEIIKENEICTQEELTEILIEKGFDVSQSTVSRDMKELNLVKVEGKEKKFKYICVSENVSELPAQIVSLFKQITVSVEAANNLIVIKTLAGNGNSAGMAIDRMQFPQVLGTIAGDDTLLVVTKNNSDAEVIIKNLKAL